MRNSIKNWRESEIIMSLGSEKELAAECRKSIPILKDAELNRAAKAMTAVLEQVGKNIRTFSKELDRRKALAGEPGPKNMVDAFRL